MATKNVSLKVLAEHIKKAAQSETDVYAWRVMNTLATSLDENFFKAGKIEKRGDFKVMCDMERY
jgi:hypothetical protein